MNLRNTIRKKLRENVEELFSSEEDKKWLQEEIQKIKNMSAEEFNEHLMYRLHMGPPFNPIEPIRSIYQEKIRECIESTGMHNLNYVESASKSPWLWGERRDTPPLPLGAMY